ncbi:MAG: RNA polymerase sigma factor [Thermomicrobiales bacterium]|nr:RNA polymerase sigma factor [Thermomicrobiales bacterium]
MDIALPGMSMTADESVAKPQQSNTVSPAALADAIPRIYGYFYPRVGSFSVAEDLTQETMLSAVRSASTPVGGDDLIRWLFAIARNKLIDYYRRQDRERNALGFQVADDDIGEQPGLPDLDLESLPIRDEVIAVLAEMNPRHRAAIVLRYFDGCEIDEIAVALFLSRSAADSLLARARNAFRSAWIARNGDIR